MHKCSIVLCSTSKSLRDSLQPWTILPAQTYLLFNKMLIKLIKKPTCVIYKSCSSEQQCNCWFGDGGLFHNVKCIRLHVQCCKTWKNIMWSMTILPSCMLPVNCLSIKALLFNRIMGEEWILLSYIVDWGICTVDYHSFLDCSYICTTDNNVYMYACLLVN